MRIIDNIICLRILWMLITPFEKTDAFKLGLIDDHGTRIRKAVTSEETNATSMLHRLVWNIKKFINLVPGGKTKIGSMVAAYALVRECIEADKFLPDSEFLQESYDKLSVDELVYLKEEINCILEDAPASNTSGAEVNTPTIKQKPIKRFKVDSTITNKFKEGTAKFRKVGAILNKEDHTEALIAQYITTNPSGFIILESETGEKCALDYEKVIALSTNKYQKVLNMYNASYKMNIVTNG